MIPGPPKGANRRSGPEYEVVTSDNDAAKAAGKAAPSVKPEDFPPGAQPNDQGTPREASSENEKRANLSAEVAKLLPVAIGERDGVLCPPEKKRRIVFLAKLYMARIQGFRARGRN